MMKMMTSWCGVMIIVSVGGGRRAVGGGLGGRLVVAARVVALVGGTSGGLAIVDGGGLTNGLERVGHQEWRRCSVECKECGLRLLFRWSDAAL